MKNSTIHAIIAITSLLVIMSVPAMSNINGIASGILAYIIIIYFTKE